MTTEKSTITEPHFFASGKEVLEFAPADILIVEDNPLNRFVFKSFLKPHGFALREAKDGKECLEAVEAKRPDLILMDIDMPVMDGETATRRLKENPETADIPVISLTGSLHGEHDKEFNRLFDGYLTKPVLAVELLETLRPFLKYEKRSA